MCRLISLWAWLEGVVGGVAHGVGMEDNLLGVSDPLGVAEPDGVDGEEEERNPFSFKNFLSRRGGESNSPESTVSGGKAKGRRKHKEKEKERGKWSKGGGEAKRKGVVPFPELGGEPRATKTTGVCVCVCI